MMLALALLAGAALVAWLLYVVREAGVLKSTATELKSELQAFKTRGFDELIKTKLDVFEREAQTQVEARERAIQQKSEE